MTRLVVTLTLNPAIDSACVADEVVPMRKVRTRDERCDPGGVAEPTQPGRLARPGRLGLLLGGMRAGWA